MGCHENVNYDKFPAQADDAGATVRVCFYYNTSRTLNGTIVRSDREAPFHTIIRLEDGRHVLATECQYTHATG